MGLDARDKVLRSFRQGTVRTLVVADVPSRSLDVPEVQRVINYDLPTTLEEYMHRIARAGPTRNGNIAISFFVSNGQGDNLKIASSLFELLRKDKCHIPVGLEA